MARVRPKRRRQGSGRQRRKNFLTNHLFSRQTALGYPGSFYADCVRTAADYVAAYNAGKASCVAPWLFGRLPDSEADPVWPPGDAVPPPANFFIKGPKAALAFAADGDTLAQALAARAAAGPNASPRAIVDAVLNSVGIDPATLGYAPGTRIPFKIFGSDATVWSYTNKAVKVGVCRWWKVYRWTHSK